MGMETGQEIEHKAALWAARLDCGPLSSADQASLDLWLDADPRHLGSFAKARAVALHSRRASALAGGDLSAVHANVSPPVNRRALIAASVGMLSVGGAGVFAALWRRSQQYETRKGEIRTIDLADGSSMVLNTQSRVSVRFSPGARSVVLTYGEALFSVVADVKRPFVVATAGARIVAGSGRLLVRRLEQSPLQVTSFDSQAKVHSRGLSSQRLVPGMAMQLDEGTLKPTSVEQVRADRILAWKNRMVAFDNDLLSQAVAEFARFSDVPIVLVDGSVAQLRITGLFSVDDPAAFARAAAISLNLRVTDRDGRIVLSEA